MIDTSKKYKTRSGLDVRIYATDGVGSFPIHGAVKESDCWRIAVWTADGRETTTGIERAYDLLESRPLVHVKGYVNVYEDSGLGGTYETREKANSGACPGRIACIHVDVTGERL